MKPYENLTDRGKARRLRKLALTALEQYRFDVADLTLIGVHTNTLFRVRTTRGSSYVIRICTPAWRTDTDLISEVMWLQALERDTNIGVPQPQPARNGDFIVIAGTKNVPAARRCVVMSWLPGTLLGKSLTEDNLYKMGVLFAQLHDMDRPGEIPALPKYIQEWESPFGVEAERYPLYIIIDRLWGGIRR